MTSPQSATQKILTAGLAAAALGLALNAVAAPSVVPTAGSYPERPVTIVAPFALGGNADTAARILAEHAPSYLGVPVAVINRTGKDGATGSVYVKNVSASGHTLLMGGSPSSVALPAARPETPYRPDDFTPLGVIEINSIGCAVAARPGSPKSAEELIKAIKTTPEKVSYAWSGEVAAQYGRTFIKQVGGAPEKIKAESYPGANDSVKAVVEGRNTFVCASMQGLRGLARLRTIELLLINEKTRNKDFPAVPTTAELNLPQLEKITAWSALFGPANLPKPVVDRWRGVLAKLAADEGWRKHMEEAGSIPHVLSPEESVSFIAEQFEIYKQFVQIGTDRK